MDDTAGPTRTSEAMVMGNENDETSSSPEMRTVDDESSAVPAPAATPIPGDTNAAAAAAAAAAVVDPVECRERSSIRAASPGQRAASITSCPTTPGPATPQPLLPPAPQPGCGCVAANAVDKDEITVCITPTTGGQFELTVDRNDTVENLKKIISKKLKVAKERICLLHRERQLREGTLAENGLQNDSRLTLLPSVETGLLAQRPEQSVMQALESLNDSQVNDFLSGKAPLNLTMRLGDHMMLIQLQLSTVTPASSSPSSANQASGASNSGHSSHNGGNSNNNNNNNVTGLPIGGGGGGGGGGGSGSGTTGASNLPGGHVSSSLQARRSLATRSSGGIVKPQNAASASAGRTSHLISSLASALHAAASYSNNSGQSTASVTTTTTSPVCSSRVTTSSSSVNATPISPAHSAPSSGTSQSQSTRGNFHGVPSTNNGTSSACQPCPLYHPHHHHSHHHYHHHHYRHHSRYKPVFPNFSFPSLSSSSSSSSASSSSGSTLIQEQPVLKPMPYDASLPRKKLCSSHHGQQSSPVTSGGVDATKSQHDESNQQSSTCTSSLILEQSSPKPATLDTRALAEASRNLTQKLKQLSSEVLTSRVDLAEENARRRQGAIIESMHHHGKGVYSGTFSGTLNPALQDRHGRPKRDISTIIHILNDLLCATPAASAGHYRHHHHRHSHARQQSSSVSASSAGSATAAGGSATSVGCHDSTSGYSNEELSKENEATKGKMRRLRLVMEQRRAKRKARRQARAAPYTTQWAAMTPADDPNHESNTSTATSSTAATAANSAEPQNEPELQPCSPEPVVA